MSISLYVSGSCPLCAFELSSIKLFFYLYVTFHCTLCHAGCILDMEPRKIIRSTKRVHDFVAALRDTLPDVSERPDIPPGSVQFWLMSSESNLHHSTRKKTSKKRYPAKHSRLPGLMAKRINKAIDDTMALNMWCVSFKDPDDGKRVTLVYDCIVCAWLHYIADMKGHPLSTSNCCQLVLKYLLMNQDDFVKAFHNRVYSFSSATKFSTVALKLMEWIKTTSEVSPQPHTLLILTSFDLTCTDEN